MSLPPRHLKTFLASICLPAWLLAHRPSARILILSYGQELADKIAYSIREILRSAWFRRLFETRIARSQLTDFITTANGCVRSVSIEGSVTGFGADIIIVDDAVQIKDCDNAKTVAARQRSCSTARSVPASIIPKRARSSSSRTGWPRTTFPATSCNKGVGRQLRLPLIAPRRRIYEIDGVVWERQKGELAASRRIQRTRRGTIARNEAARVRDPAATKPRCSRSAVHKS